MLTIQHFLVSVQWVYWTSQPAIESEKPGPGSERRHSKGAPACSWMNRTTYYNHGWKEMGPEDFKRVLEVFNT